MNLCVLIFLSAMGDGGAISQDPSVAKATPPDAASSPATKADTISPELSLQTFPTRALPRPRRTQVWTKDRRGNDPDFPFIHESRFLRFARPKSPPFQQHKVAPGEAQVLLLRFADAVIADLKDALDLACPKARCAPMMDEARRQLATFVRNRGRDFSRDESHGSRRFHHWYAWRLQNGTTNFELGCDDQDESPEVTCWLDLDLPGQLVMSYHPKTAMADVGAPDISVQHKGDATERTVGEIRFERLVDAPVVRISSYLIAGGSL